MSNYKHRIALLENKRWELNGLIHSSKTSHSDINALRANEAEVLSQMRELSKKLSELQRETRSVEHQIANESKQERERKWLSITHDDLEINMNDIINDLQQLDKSIHEDELELSSFESKRDKTLSIINLADDLQEELKDLCKQKSKIVVDQLTGEKADQLNKAYLAKQQECKSALERANDAKEEFCIIDT